MNSIYNALWFVSIVLHINLHASQQLLVPEHYAALPGAGVIRFVGLSILESDCIDGGVTLANVIMVSECERWGGFG